MAHQARCTESTPPNLLLNKHITSLTKYQISHQPTRIPMSALNKAPT